MDALEEPALIADLEGRIAHANRAAAAVLNISDPDLLSGVELSRILEPTWDKPGRKIVKIQGSDAESERAPSPRSQRLYRSDGREYGSLVIFGTMERRESLLLEASAAEANAAFDPPPPGPSAAGPGYEVGGFLDPCLSGSGDFFDVFQAGEGLVAFYGLDVMGHGIIASLMAFSLQTLLPILGRETIGKAPSPAEVAQALYERYSRKGEGPKRHLLHDRLRDHRGATGDYKVARAGYTPVLHLEAGGRMRVHYTKGVGRRRDRDAEVEEATGPSRRATASCSPPTACSLPSATACSSSRSRASAPSRTRCAGPPSRTSSKAFRRQGPLKRSGEGRPGGRRQPPRDTSVS